MSEDERIRKQREIEKAAAASLRQRAERLTNKKHADIESLSENDLKSLLYELEVHQVELEIQNEELRDTQQALTRSRDHYANLFEFSPVGYLMLSDDGFIQRANTTAAKLLEVSATALVGTKLSNYVAAESQDVFYLHQQSILIDGIHRACRLTLKTDEQSQRQVSLESQILPKRLDAEHSWRAALVDITDYQMLLNDLGLLNNQLEDQVKRRSEALYVSEARLKAIIQSASDAIVTIDKNGIIDSVNAATARMFGYAESDMIGRNVRMFMPEPYHEEHDNYIARYIETGEKHIIGNSRELLAKHGDGHLFPISLSVGQIDAMSCFAGVMRDMTEQKRLEREVLNVAESERGRISRELHDGTSQQVVGMSLIAKTIADNRRADNVEEAAEIMELSDNLRSIAVDLRRTIYELAPVELEREDLSDALDNLAKTTDERNGIRCRLSCLDPSAVEVKDRGVATQLLRIAQEAVHNALKHAQAELILITLCREGDWIRLEIVDDGEGIADVSAKKGDSMGMRIMRYRAGVIGATLMVGNDAVTGGVRVSCGLPISAL